MQSPQIKRLKSLDIHSGYCKPLVFKNGNGNQHSDTTPPYLYHSLIPYKKPTAAINPYRNYLYVKKVTGRLTL